jgi:hypothetical protein
LRSLVVASTTAILSILRTGQGAKARHTALLTFETEGGSGEEYLRFVPGFFDVDLNSELDSLRRKLAEFEVQYARYLKAPSSQDLEKLLARLRQIGELLFLKFSCTRILDNLFRNNSIKNLVIYTNDPEIPWQWTYDATSGMFACERFAVGKLFMQDVNREERDALQTFVAARDEDENILELHKFLKKKSALILVGAWIGEPKQMLPKATDEVARLIETFRGKKFGDVKVVEGDDVEFLSRLRTMAPRLKIIHYAGHSTSAGLMPNSKSVVSAQHISEAAKPLNSNPVVFLNGCMTGEVADIWRKNANLATSFLALGACGCVVTAFPVTDRAAAAFSVSFYEEVLKADSTLTIGEALRIIRIQQASDSRLRLDLTRLFFDYYGDPRARLKASRLNRIRAAQTATYERKKVYQGLKSQLK